MLRLRRANDVENAICLKTLYSVPDRAEIGRRVPEALVRLLDDQRERLAFAIDETGWEHAERALGFHEQAKVAEIVDERWQTWVVKALTDHVAVFEQHTELLVDLVEVSDALLDEHAPESQRLLVA